jgi:hypothetical protein
MICFIQLKSPQGASKIFLNLYSLISLVISFRILEVFSNSEPGPETLSLELFIFIKNIH